MRIFRSFLLVAATLAGCARAPLPFEENTIERESAASQHDRHDGKIIGALGGATGGAVLGYSSAGVLCAIGGPLCAIVVVPAMIVGGVAGGAAGSVVDAANSSRADEAARKASTADTAPLRADTSAPQGG